MQAKVKNVLEQQERDKKNKRVKRPRGFSTKMPKAFFEYPIYRELKDVILCSDKSKICPRRWDELEVDFENENIWYCSVCKQNVMKVTNQYNLEEIKDTNACISVPLNGVLHKSFSEELKSYIELYILVQISRMTMQGSGYSEEDDIHSNTVEEIVRTILPYLKNDGWISINDFIRNCQQYDVDFVAIFGILRGIIEDEELRADMDVIVKEYT